MTALTGFCAALLAWCSAAAPAFAQTNEGDAEALYLRPVLQCQTIDDSDTSTGALPTESASSTTTDVGALDVHGFPLQASDPNTQQFLPLKGEEPVYCLVGPAEGTGHVFDGNAQAVVLPSGWGVSVDLRSGSEGEGVFNAVAARCHQLAATCPTGQLALELNGVIQSAPSMNASSYTGGVEIAGNFTEDEARQLARVINAMSLESFDSVTSTTESAGTVVSSTESRSAGNDDASNTTRVVIVVGVLLVLAAAGWYAQSTRRKRQASVRADDVSIGGARVPESGGSFAAPTQTGGPVAGTDQEG